MRQFYQNINKWHPFFAKVGLGNAILAILFLLLMFIDDRTLLGVNIWLKPLKFAMSLVIFSWTLIWLIHTYNYSEKWTKRAGNFFAILTIIEIVTIASPAIWGIESHYNFSNPYSALNFGLMGLAIHLTTLGLLIMMIQSFFRKLNAKPAMIWAIRFGWLCLFFSLFGGEVMVGQSGHNVGVPDGGAGLPLTNWSTEGGDLRVMHFFGLHALQLLPLFAYFLEEKQLFKNEKLRIVAVILVGLWYISWVGYLYFQAMDGIPFFSV